MSDTADRDTVLDGPYGNLSLPVVPDAPVAAPAGVTDTHGEARAALRTRTVGDPGRHPNARRAVAPTALQGRAR